MHWCYGIFYLETVLPVLLMWWRYPRSRFHAMVASQFLALAICAIMWLVYPAEVGFNAAPHFERGVGNHTAGCMGVCCKGTNTHLARER